MCFDYIRSGQQSGYKGIGKTQCYVSKVIHISYQSRMRCLTLNSCGYNFRPLRAAKGEAQGSPNLLSMFKWTGAVTGDCSLLSFSAKLAQSIDRLPTKDQLSRAEGHNLKNSLFLKGMFAECYLLRMPIQNQCFLGIILC